LAGAGPVARGRGRAAAIKRFLALAEKLCILHGVFAQSSGGNFMTDQSPLTTAAFEATPEQTRALLDWFDRYDAHARDNDTEAMADVARFPLTVATNDSGGEFVTQQWDRDTFIRNMSMAATSAKIDNERRPVFLNADLAVVITDSAVTADGRTLHMRYADVMAKVGGEWRFTSMIQAGWGDLLNQYPAG
jgi:hypothetical protein